MKSNLSQLAIKISIQNPRKTGRSTNSPSKSQIWGWATRYIEISWSYSIICRSRLTRILMAFMIKRPTRRQLKSPSKPKSNINKPMQSKIWLSLNKKLNWRKWIKKPIFLRIRSDKTRPFTWMDWKRDRPRSLKWWWPCTTLSDISNIMTITLEKYLRLWNMPSTILVQRKVSSGWRSTWSNEKRKMINKIIFKS